MYAFKPLHIVLREKCDGNAGPKARSGHRIVSDESNVYSYGGFNPSINDPDMNDDAVWCENKPLFKELWRFNISTNTWRKLPGYEEMPKQLISNAIVMQGSTLFVYGGTGVPFGSHCSNKIFVCNVNSGKWEEISTKGNDRPEAQYGQSMICEGSHLYTVGGTTGYEYNCDIYRIDLRTRVWERVYICTGVDQSEPKGRYRHELAYDGQRIYVFGGGTSHTAFGFKDIPAFDMELRRWIVLKTYGTLSQNGHRTWPSARRCHGLVQYTDEDGTVYAVISGGYNGTDAFGDVWKIDLSTMQWTCLTSCVLPSPIYFHSASITPQGQMFIFGGIVQQRDSQPRSEKIYSAWLVFPKLTEMCWEAICHYSPHIKNLPPEQLKLIGLPFKFIQRIDFAWNAQQNPNNKC